MIRPATSQSRLIGMVRGIAAAVLAAIGGTCAVTAQAPTVEQLIKQLECRAGQDCQASPPGAGLPSAGERPGLDAGPGGAGTKRSFRFKPATEGTVDPAAQPKIQPAAKPVPPPAAQATVEQVRQEVEKRADAGKLPSADLEIYFDFNAVMISAQAQQALMPLGSALTDPRLAGFRFVLVGHTDGKGGSVFNQKLSERRAAAVKDYLVRQFAISPGRLDTYGRGKSLLKNVALPVAPENRRVQVINQGAAQAGVRR
jgi:OmpA-OmpF porin, OOP family